jgi:membrane protease YdiL (CAAX protease family)
VAAGRAPDPIAVLESLAFAFPLAFLVDEVSFRGAVDSYLYRPGDRFAWSSALFVSSLWAVWHVPAMMRGSPGSSFVGLALVRILWQPVFSVPLSLAWRQTGNLAIPAFFHMVIDAVAQARP